MHIITLCNSCGLTTLHSWRCQKWSYDRCKQAWIWPCYLPSQCSTVASIRSTAYVFDVDLSNFTKDTYSMNIRMFLDYCDWTKKLTFMNCEYGMYCHSTDLHRSSSCWSGLQRSIEGGKSQGEAETDWAVQAKKAFWLTCMWSSYSTVGIHLSEHTATKGCLYYWSVWISETLLFVYKAE